jgi:hypothetical protein
MFLTFLETQQVIIKINDTAIKMIDTLPLKSSPHSSADIFHQSEKYLIIFSIVLSPIFTYNIAYYQIKIPKLFTVLGFVVIMIFYQT